MSPETEARGFLRIGGRIMLTPEGKLVTAINAALLLPRVRPIADPEAPFAARRRINSRFARVEDNHAPELAQLAARHGHPVDGWMVWRAAA